MKAPMPTVVCVLRGGREFLPEHVRVLREGVGRWWPAGRPLRFVALTDTPVMVPGVEERPLVTNWERWWSKMEIHSPQHMDLGTILYFDLDTVIVGPLHDIVRQTQLTLLSDFYKLDRAQSGMMMLPVDARPTMHTAWATRSAYPAVRGDGEFLNMFWREEARWQTVLPSQIVSYKVTVRTRNRVPDPARVVCFHGNPRPWETALWPGNHPH